MNNIFAIVCCLIFPVADAAAQSAVAEISWTTFLQPRLHQIDGAHDGDLGVYVKDLGSGASVSLRGEEFWYLASGVKVPVAIVVLQQIEQGKFTLDTSIRLRESHYVDGAGQTNRRQPGSLLPISYLLEQMIIYSDNTATDLLIELVNIDQVNQLIHRQVSEGFGTITTLADVRRYIYAGLHPSALELAGKDFLSLKAKRDDAERLLELARLLNIGANEFAVQDFDSAFAAYYATQFNVGTLAAYTRLMEALVDGQILNAAHTQYLLDLMFRVKTGARRIKAGLPATVRFAHKTGTQHRRICDLGLAVLKTKTRTRREPRVLISACSRDFSSLADAELALKQVGEAVAESGVLDFQVTPNANKTLCRSEPCAIGDSTGR